MYAVYDLCASPPSYEFVTFLSMAVIDASLAGLKRLHVLFVPGPIQGFKGDKKAIPYDSLLWRKNNILIPACGLVGATHTTLEHYSEMEDYQGFHIWQPAWSPDYRKTWYGQRILIEAYNRGHDLPPLHVAPWAGRKVSEWLGQKPYVTITLRNAHALGRNSKDAVWLAFANWLRKQGIHPVIIPDTSDAISGDALGAMAALNLHIRHALYAGAAMNFGVNTGPMILCVLGGLPYVMCHMICETWKSTSREFLAKHGLPEGSQFPWSNASQRLVWEDESLEMLQHEYHRANMRNAA